MAETENGAGAARPLSSNAKAFLLALARQTITCTVQSQISEVPPGETVPAEVRRTAAAFVTLTLAGELRGCVGQLQAQHPLYESVMEAARGAASRDTRFSPVTASELPLLHIHLSVLHEAQKLNCSGPQDVLERLRPGVDGVILTLGAKTATFLPTVWERVESKVAFLEMLSLKAGLRREDWKSRDSIISIYRTEDFEESSQVSP